LPNEQAYILDRQGEPVPIGVRGELHLGGDKLARGYLNRQELTREKFIELPFEPRARVYRTGDAARFLADGSIEFLGRLDQQVKIRGYRIELGELEAALSRHASVAESFTVARSEPSGNGHRLISYVVRVPGSTVAAHDLRQHLLERLPDYMVPSGFVVMDSLPRTTSGKVDGAALPEPEFASDGAAYVAPRSTTEQLLVEIWGEVLGVEQVGIEDNFFELGGHSLLATQVLSRIHDSLGVELSLRQFFAAPTVVRIAPAIEAALLEDIQASMGAETETSSPALAVAKE
jgi:acyl carrier protein